MGKNWGRIGAKCKPISKDRRWWLKRDKRTKEIIGSLGTAHLRSSTENRGSKSDAGRKDDKAGECIEPAASGSGSAFLIAGLAVFHVVRDLPLGRIGQAVDRHGSNGG